MSGKRQAVAELLPQDLIVAQRLCHWAWLRKGYPSCIAVWLCCVVAFNALTWLVPGAPEGMRLAMTLQFGFWSGLAMALIPTLWVYLVGPSIARKTYRIQASIRGPFNVCWDDDLVRFTSEGGEARLKWAEVYRVAANASAFLLYESELLVRIIPKRCLTSEQIADIAALAETVRDLRNDLQS